MPIPLMQRFLGDRQDLEQWFADAIEEQQRCAAAAPGPHLPPGRPHRLNETLWRGAAPRAAAKKHLIDLAFAPCARILMAMANPIHSPMSSAWQIQEAKARFKELLRASLEQGPQTVTRRGVPLAVVVSAEQWNTLCPSASATGPSLKDLLLADVARTDQLVAPRSRSRRRRALRLG